MTQAGLVSWAQGVLAAEVSSPLNDVAGAVLEPVEASAKAEARAKALREALGEWIQALKSLREWMHDKSTPRDDAETDRRYARVEAAEKTARAALARDAGREGT